VLACGEQETCIESGGAPFFVLALVIWFGGNIRDEVIGTDRKSSLNREFVLVAPCETAIFPVKIRAVLVREQEPSLPRKMERRDCLHAIFGQSTRRDDVSVSSFQHQRS